VRTVAGIADTLLQILLYGKDFAFAGTLVTHLASYHPVSVKREMCQIMEMEYFFLEMCL
jgi:hypothetical protein